MEITVHGPADPGASAEMARRVAAIHAEAVITYIRKLPGSRQEKLALLRGAYSDRGGTD